MEVIKMKQPTKRRAPAPPPPRITSELNNIQHLKHSTKLSPSKPLLSPLRTTLKNDLRNPFSTFKEAGITSPLPNQAISKDLAYICYTDWGSYFIVPASPPALGDKNPFGTPKSVIVLPNNYQPTEPAVVPCKREDFHSVINELKHLQAGKKRVSFEADERLCRCIPSAIDGRSIVEPEDVVMNRRRRRGGCKRLAPPLPPMFEAQPQQICQHEQITRFTNYECKKTTKLSGTLSGTIKKKVLEFFGKKQKKAGSEDCHRLVRTNSYCRLDDSDYITGIPRDDRFYN